MSRRKTGPDQKTRELVLERDGHRCLTCGTTWDLTINHRINRGMGGSRLLNSPENLTTACATCNSSYENHPEAARRFGWKALRGSDLTAIPVRAANLGWYRLDADGGRVAVEAVA